MLDADRINEIHRLHQSEHWSVRKIARHLHLARRTIRRYVDSPARTPDTRARTAHRDWASAANHRGSGDVEQFRR